MAKMKLLASLLSFALLLFIVHPCVGASDRAMVVVFKGDHTEVPFEEDNSTITIRKPPAFHVPAFIGGIFNEKELLMVICNARYTNLSDWGFIEPAARTSYGDYTKWSAAEIVIKNSRKSSKKSVVGGVTTVMKGDKIYVLAPSWDELDTNWFYQNHNTGWDPLMIVGTVMNRTESEGGGVHVKWDKGSSLKSLLPKKVLGAQGFQFIGGLGNGVVTKNGTIIFPIQIANNRWQYASSIMYSTDDGSTWHIGATTEQDTSEGSVTEWKNGKLLLSVRYYSGYRKVYESDDMGTTWKESTVFSWLWGNQVYLMGFGSPGGLITVPVDGEDVLIFSKKKNMGGRYIRDTLQLWISDGQRIKCVGPISEDGKGERSGYSIMAHVGDHLYIVHEINPYEVSSTYNSAKEDWNRVIALSSLPNLFDSVKSTVRAWRQVDEELKNIKVPTYGLVGFLADNKNNTIWKDEYNCVHANVNGATRVRGGFRFDGTQGSGAQWPVQSQGYNQVYFSTETQFTLAATVKIHSTAIAGEHLLLGASVDTTAGEMVFIGLGYTQENKWSVVDDNGMIMTTGVSFELEKEYHVAITFANRAVSVYVDGVFIINWKKTNYGSSPMSHFFMGGIGKLSTTKSCLCTVKHVMLFNRVLNNSEIDGIKNVGKYANQKESISMTIITDLLFAPKTTATTDPQETADISTLIIPDEDENDNEEINAFTTSARSTDDTESDSEGLEENCDDIQHHSNDRDSKKEEKRVDGAVGSISFTARMCFVCTAIVLAWL